MIGFSVCLGVPHENPAEQSLTQNFRNTYLMNPTPPITTHCCSKFNHLLFDLSSNMEIQHWITDIFSLIPNMDEKSHLLLNGSWGDVDLSAAGGHCNYNRCCSTDCIDRYFISVSGCWQQHDCSLHDSKQMWVSWCVCLYGCYLDQVSPVKEIFDFSGTSP